MRIDTHMHITPPDIIRFVEKISHKEPYFKWLSETPHNKFATGDVVQTHLKEHDFDYGIVFGFAFQDPALCRYVNDYTIEQIKKYPDQLKGYMVVSPRDGQMLYEMERCYEAGLCGIGELFPAGQEWVLTGDAKTKELALFCERYQLPILLHANETVGHPYAGKTAVPLEHMQAFIHQHSKTPIILAHFGGGLLFYETMGELKEAFEHVYYDTAASLFLYDTSIYRVAREIGILDKVIFGSDYPLLPIGRYEQSLQQSGLTPQQIKGILGDNYYKIIS